MSTKRRLYHRSSSPIFVPSPTLHHSHEQGVQTRSQTKERKDRKQTPDPEVKVLDEKSVPCTPVNQGIPSIHDTAPPGAPRKQRSRRGGAKQLSPNAPIRKLNFEEAQLVDLAGGRTN